MSLWQRTFIWCTAADIEAIEQCPNDWNKFSVIGATIFMTAVIAGISGGYFISYYLEIAYNMHGWTIPICFGILWAFLIFTLDRTIIVTMKKTGILKEELKQGSIRLILAIFIGLVIATPLELKMFEGEIDAKIEDLNRERNDFIVEQDELKRARNATQEKEILEQKLKPLREELGRLEQIKSDYDKANQDRIGEAEGTSGTGKVGKGPVYDEKDERYNEKKEDWKKVEEQYNSLQQEINKLLVSKNTQSNISAVNVDDIKQVNGVEIRVKALYKLSGLHWFVTLLFILIECLPVISKLMSKRGCYDEVIDRIEHENMVKQNTIKSEINSEINELLTQIKEFSKLKTDLKLKIEKDNADAELANNKIIRDTIAQIQQELALLTLEKWREKELTKINLDNITSSTI